MKLISTKKGSSRERVDAEIDLLPIPSWRVVWQDPVGGFVKPKGRHLVLSSSWGGGERTSELWLSEEEAAGVAKVFIESLFADARAQRNARPSDPQRAGDVK